MSYYRTCPYCGSHLDPGEKCDCSDQINVSLDDERIDQSVRRRAAGKYRFIFGDVLESVAR